MTTPEGKVKAKVKLLLKKYGAWWHMPVMNGMGAPGLDFHAVVKGKAFFVETKAGDKQPTPRQHETIKQIQLAGAPAFVVNEVSGMDLLESWLQEVTQ